MNLEVIEFKPAISPGMAMVVVNPEAGRGSPQMKERYAERVSARLQQYGWEVRQEMTMYAGHETRFAEQAVNGGYDAVFAASGDGSSQRMLQVLTGSSTILGVAPMGFINLWAGETGIPRTPEQAVDAQLTGTVRAMDVGVVNGIHHFRTTLGTGFDGSILKTLSRFQDRNGRRRLRGTALYFAACALKYPFANETEAEIHVGEDTVTTPMFEAWTGNTRRLGFMELRPEGRVDDGQLELTVFPKLGPIDFPRNAGRALLNFASTRSGDRVPAGLYLQAPSMTIETASDVYAHVDGELMSTEPTRIHTVTTRPNSLRVFVPQTPAASSLFQ